MAAWIASKPDAEPNLSLYLPVGLLYFSFASLQIWFSAQLIIYRRVMISQDRHEIYITIAEYDSNYIKYLNGKQVRYKKKKQRAFIVGNESVWPIPDC